ncbi:hypothetical protein GIY30_09005 [Gordonia sp. HNM0687]|uniref:Uncharacterized protein n=1 Tax=Gordonia mangrovi TaxID=2665643 RepID=A0A6L7GSI1_9ACTN|nr:hypothetical protein [Gordonia mangrovi]MXP21488.1 hypothetical protein [Gordonia mangrovi]UVF80236.1 hypothetical protein NWF22_10590 [Gordonia mangrovi]
MIGQPRSRDLAEAAGGRRLVLVVLVDFDLVGVCVQAWRWPVAGEDLEEAATADLPGYGTQTLRAGRPT